MEAGGYRWLMALPRWHTLGLCRILSASFEPPSAMIASDADASPVQAPPAAKNRSPTCDRLFYLLLFLLALIVLATFKQYGISVDEGLQKNYGHLLLSFYLSGFEDRHVFDYFNLHYYGGFFDLISALLAHVSPLSEYDTRHLLCAVIGLGGILGVRQVGRLVGGARVGLLAAVLLAITGAYYGAMFNNTKDVPFAAGMIWVVYFGCRLVASLPKPSFAVCIAFGTAIGLSLGVRVGALFGVVYVLPAIALSLVGLARSAGGPSAAAATGALLVRLLLGMVSAVLLMALFWPWSVLAPGNIFAAVTALSDMDIYTVIAGEGFNAPDDPRWYLPVYLLVKLPELLLLGAAAGLVALIIPACSQSPAADSTCSKLFPWSVVVLSVIIPIGFAVIARPALYNGLRHFLFVVPPLCVIAAAGIERIWTDVRRLSSAAAFALAAGAASLVAKDVWTLIALHPHQYVYYNLLVGGVNGVDGRYEMDYWSNFAPEAFRLLGDRLKWENGGRMPDRPIAVAFCYPDWFPPWIFQTYAPPPLVQSRDTCNGAEFYVSTTNTGCDEVCSGKTIVVVERLGVVLGVVKDLRMTNGKHPPSASVKRP